MKKIIISIIMVLCLLALISCEEEHIYWDQIRVSIKSEYKDKFMNKAFTDEDFNFENIEKVEYFLWFDKPDVGFLNVYLKETGKRKVEEAIKHFKELEFVQRICIYSEYLYIMLFINNVNRIITKNINKMNIALAKLLRKR